MHLIDTHCHLDVYDFYRNVEEVVHSARRVGVQEFVIPGVNRLGWMRLMALSQLEPGIHAAPGLHPMYLSDHAPDHLEELEAIAETGLATAIGEIGLDFFVEELDREVQQRLFEHQLDIAKRAQLPVLIHVRKAHDQVLAALRRKHFPWGGIVHAFSGSYQQAAEFIKLGFAIGVCGTITYNRATKIRKNCQELPAEWLVLETDAPDIVVASHREEECNLPQYLPEVLFSLADLRGENPEVVANYTTINARRILGLQQNE